MNLYGIIMLSAGAVLMYAAVQNADPRDVVRNALQGKPTAKAAPAVVTKPSVAPVTPNDGTKVVSV
jgi:hypothetical protein